MSLPGRPKGEYRSAKHVGCLMSLRRAAAMALLGWTTMTAAAIDLNALWDFSNPALSEQRFTAALPLASPDDALILQTQIARTWGLRKDFDRARALLLSLQPQLPTTSAEARARHALELGRSHASATHPRESLTEAAKTSARQAYGAALVIAKSAQLDSLAIDAIHMLAFVDTAPADQLRWGREALAVTLASTQPAGQAWQASIRTNIGLALHQLGQFDAALAEFEQALALRQQQGNARTIHIAHWMVAWTLRALQRHDEALTIQLRLEREADATTQPDPHVFAELELLYRALGNEARAQHYGQRRWGLAR